MSRTAFFYGTLMHPRILRRVIGNDGSHLQICPGILLDHTRHQVRYADYPGILPYEESKTMFKGELEPEERSVRGTLVTGLTDADMVLLDIFEGNVRRPLELIVIPDCRPKEYGLKKVFVHPLGTFCDLESDNSLEKSGSIVPTSPPPLPPISDLPDSMEVETYIYARMANLNPDLWSFEEFVKNNAWKWYGRGADENVDFTEVDRRNRRSS
jgi:hypothetical protein